MERTLERLPLELVRVRDAVLDRYRHILNRHALTEQQWRVIDRLKQDEELDATRLALRTGIQPPSITRIVRGLDQRGLLEIRRDPDDARRALLRLTAEGHALGDALAPQIRAAFDGIGSAHGAKRLDDLVGALESLRRSLGMAQ